MKQSKLKCNQKVRELLVELDQAFQRKSEQTAQLARTDLPHHTAIEVGRNRESTNALILGIAWRINKASKGAE